MADKDKNRPLPSWMTRKQTLRVKEPLKANAKRKTARNVFYCMNEKELVGAALALLTEEPRRDAVPAAPQEVEGKERASKTTGQTSTSHVSTKRKTSADSPECSNHQADAYFSETDLDISEVQTVPYATISPHTGVEAQRRSPDQAHSGLTEPSVVTAEENEEDAFQLVKDIFFS